MLRHLCYGRVRLDAMLSTTAFETGGRETALLCMRGACRVSVVRHRRTTSGSTTRSTFRAGSFVEVTTSLPARSTWSRSPPRSAATIPLQVIRYNDLAKDPKLKFTAGGAATTRDLNIVIGDNVRAGRILAGFTRSQPGNWTSWPPHEHGAILEEVYVYFDMPPPSFGIQMVYTQPGEPELAAVVRDGDAVLMPGGYHPNVAAPGHSINFIWMMAAHREKQDRLFGVVNVQPGFDKSGSGLEASRK